MKTHSLPHPQTQLLAADWEGSVIDKLADFPPTLSCTKAFAKKWPLNQNWPLSLLTADGHHISFVFPWSPSEGDFPTPLHVPALCICIAVPAFLGCCRCLQSLLDGQQWVTIPQDGSRRSKQAFPPMNEPPEGAFWTRPFLVPPLPWQGVPTWLTSSSSFLESCYLTALSFFPFLQLVDVPGPCHSRDTFMILERWDREKEAAVKLKTDPAFLGLLTCLYPAASPLTGVWYFLLWPTGFLFVIRSPLQTSWKTDSMPLSWVWMMHKPLNL